MTESKHSKLLSPSGSGLWLTCTAMPQAFIDSGAVAGSSHAADRGTLQHHYAEKLREGTLEFVCPEDLDPDEWDQVVTATSAIDNFFESEGTFESGKTQYREYLELEVAFNDWRSDCFGTADVVRFDTRLKTLYVMDYKFGRVYVPSEKNSQLMIYALGTIEHMKTKKVDLTKLVERVVLGIAQPKIKSELDKWEMPIDGLLKWDAEVLQPAQKAILNNEGVKFVPGAHCRDKYCKHLKNCEAANAQGSADMDSFIEMYNSNTIGTMSMEELAAVLDKAPLVEGLLAAARDRAYTTIDSGDSVPGYKLVNGRGKRQWTDEEEAETFLKNQKLKIDERYRRTLITLPQAETLLAESLENPRTKARFDELTEYVPGKPTLVSEADPRPAIVKEENIDTDINDMFGLDDLDDIDALLEGIETDTDGKIEDDDDLDSLLASL